MSKKRVIVIGGGPAGLMAAGQAAAAGADTILLEKMPHPGRKLSITGKGRCNVTNVADRSAFVNHFGRTAPFLDRAFDSFFTPELTAFMETVLDVPLVTERGGRVFPASGRAPDITRALVQWAERAGVSVHTHAAVKELIIEDGKAVGVRLDSKDLDCDAVVLATGGCSYPATGSTGDGYHIAEKAGHRITDITPALVPLETGGSTAERLQGLELRNIRAVLEINDRDSGRSEGELVFTDYGITGPVTLTLSGRAVKALKKGEKVEIVLDLKPGLSEEKLRARIDRDFDREKDEKFAVLLRGLLPREMISVCADDLRVPESRLVSTLEEDIRTRLTAWLKSLRLPVTAHRPLDEAIVTAGGVDTTEINPGTMESRAIKGLYFAGEVMDVQADTGGYNLQAAFSTGWLAGCCAAGGEAASAGPDALTSAASGNISAKTVDTAAFLPTTREELEARGWDGLDVIIVTGDSYIDSPFVGAAVIGRVLEKEGFRVGIIAQPDADSGDDISRLGEPRLFWGVTAGCIDSMVANRTASGKRRKHDDYTPGGINDKRPDRASIVYSNLIRKHFKNTAPIVLGGIEASLRRVAHYDFWADKVRRSILFDAKADYLLYGMAERSVVELARCLDTGEDVSSLRGLCYTAKEKPESALELPSFKSSAEDKQVFTDMFHSFYRNNDPITAVPLAQLQDTRYLVQNPPALYLSTDELDDVHALTFTREQHPFYAAGGDVRALDTIRFSIATHRGCYGECHFCAIAVHQGRTVRWRSRQSIIAEAVELTRHPAFRGRIHDVGGPTANMYGFECMKKTTEGCCPGKRCVFPSVCKSLPVNHGPQIELLKALRSVKGVKQVVVASGIRHDLVLADPKNGEAWLREIVRQHVSGQMKIAPEHSEPGVLELMAKPGPESLLKFREMFYRLTAEAGKDQYLTYYMIAAHPGCTMKDMARLKEFAVHELKIRPEQVQVFTPTPSTYSTLMYWTGRDPFTGKKCFVERSEREREQQKYALTAGVSRRR